MEKVCYISSIYIYINRSVVVLSFSPQGSSSMEVISKYSFMAVTEGIDAPVRGRRNGREGGRTSTFHRFLLYNLHRERRKGQLFINTCCTLFVFSFALCLLCSALCELTGQNVCSNVYVVFFSFSVLLILISSTYHRVMWGGRPHLLLALVF